MSFIKKKFTMVLGTIIRDTQIRAIKSAKKHTNHNHQGTGPSSFDSPDPSGPRTRVPTRPTPQGLERKFRLARPRPGSGTGPHSTWAARLPPHGARTHDMTDAMASIPQQGKATTIPTTLGTAASPFSLCALTSFTVAYRLTVEREWGRLISTTI